MKRLIIALAAVIALAAGSSAGQADLAKRPPNKVVQTARHGLDWEKRPPNGRAPALNRVAFMAMDVDVDNGDDSPRTVPIDAAGKAGAIYSFTHGNNYCTGTGTGSFEDQGAQVRERTYQRLDSNGDQVINSVHVWANSDTQCDGQNVTRCGPELDSPATTDGRIRIYGVRDNGTVQLIEDRNFTLTDGNNCDYLMGTTQDWFTHMHHSNVRVDYDLKRNQANDNDNQYLRIWRDHVALSVDPDGERWGCEGGDVGPNNGICYSNGPF